MNFDARTYDRSAQGAAKGNTDIALNGSLDSVRKVTLASGTMRKKERGQDDEIQHDLSPASQTDLPKETAKIPKAKGQKVSANPEKETKFMQVQCTNSSCDY